MAIRIVRVRSLLFGARALGPTLAHLLELPNKITLARDAPPLDASVDHSDSRSTGELRVERDGCSP
jgi:hypothetical protein